MPRTRALRHAVAALPVALLTACAAAAQPGSTAAELRPAQDTPARFITSDGVVPEESCRVTMLDPRDQTSLRLARSAQYGMSYRGDYEVPDGRYGVQRGELLRIDCGTGEPIGVVRAG